MEEQLKKINTHLSKKKIVRIRTRGVVSKDGTLNHKLRQTLEFNEESDYYVYLILGNFNSYFPNVTEDNNKLYYSEPNSTDIKEITLDNGAYEVEIISKRLQYHTNQGITIDIDKGNGKSLIYLKPGYKFYLKEKSPHVILGYDPTKEYELKDPENKSPNMCSVMRTDEIFISMNIIEGGYFNENKCRILYSFPNSVEWGVPINIKPKHLERCKLAQQQFIDFTYTFTNEKNEPIDFMGHPVSLRIEIAEV